MLLKKITDQCRLAKIDKRIDIVLRTKIRDLTTGFGIVDTGFGIVDNGFAIIDNGFGIIDYGLSPITNFGY